MPRKLNLNAVPEHPDWHYGLTIAHGEGFISTTLYGPNGVQLEIDRLDTSVTSRHSEADRLITEYEASNYSDDDSAST